MKLKLFLGFFGLVICCIILAILFFAQLFMPTLSEKKEFNFSLSEKITRKEVSQTLQKKGLIHSSIPFDIYVNLVYGERNFVKGEYKIFTPITAAALAKLLMQGPGFQERAITIIEGWNRKDIARYLEKEHIATEKDFLEMTHTAEPFLDIGVLSQKPKNVDMEGYLFPDTYRIFEHATSEDIIRKMIENLNSKITPEIITEIKSHNQTIHKMLTLASIVEREVQSDADRAIVADMLYRRLKLGMPLQVDSTISFITGKQTDRSSLSDLQIDSPYNTYKYKGLPPGPIANPGLSSIRAVVYPKPNEYLFFLTTSEGEVKYARTYEEHLENKRKYLK